MSYINVSISVSSMHIWLSKLRYYLAKSEHYAWLTHFWVQVEISTIIASYVLTLYHLFFIIALIETIQYVHMCK